MKVIYSDAALEDVHDIMGYLEESFSIREVDAFLFLLDSFEQTVTKFPNGFAVFDQKLGLRRAVMRCELSVFYLVSGGLIEVVSVFDNRREPLG